MSKETIDLKDLDDLLCKYEVKDLEDLENRFKNVPKLEAKLAESEKKFIVANNLRKNSDEVLLNYKTKKYGLDKTIQELRKMKLSLPEKEWYYKGFENCERQMSSHIADLTLEVNELKQQLAEKEKEIEYQENMKILAVNNQNKKAIEQLEKVKDIINASVRDDHIIWDFDIKEHIDNQINELKEIK